MVRLLERGGMPLTFVELIDYGRRITFRSFARGSTITLHPLS